jgi:hypothetical protein
METFRLKASAGRGFSFYQKNSSATALFCSQQLGLHLRKIKAFSLQKLGFYENWAGYGKDTIV